MLLAGAAMAFRTVAILPFLGVEVAVIFLLTCFPALTLTVPGPSGFVQYLQASKKGSTLLKKTLMSLVPAALLTGTAGTEMAQEIMLRATAKSHENNADCDGLVVFKTHVENASICAIGVKNFMVTRNLRQA